MQSFELRSWQREAIGLYKEQYAIGKKVLLWEATPGAGKTAAALEVVKHQLGKARATSALIVVPTSHLRTQWARSAARVGVQLDSTFGGKRTSVASDFHGAVVTYQYLKDDPVFRNLANRSVVVLDEVHHAGEGLVWGNTLRSTLQNANFILCLSGTPFRSDSNPIPFVQYDNMGISRPDYSYSYTKAVEEGVCRPIAFFAYGGEVSWAENEVVSTANFSDNLDPLTSSRRLRAALDPDAGWIQPLLKDAHQALRATREQQPRAGGLIVCSDQDHARQLAKVIATISGQKATVVLSDDATSSKKIKSFADGSDQWLVACNMVSEGVDIPRLRVGVYATTIRTKMYFRQFLGRVVRKQGERNSQQAAYVYLPADPYLRQLAEEIELETKHILRGKGEDFWAEKRELAADRAEAKERNWRPLEGINSGLDAVIVNGSQLSLFGGAAAPEAIKAAVDQEIEIQLEERLTKSELKAKLCSDIKFLVGQVHRRTGKPHSAIHGELNRAQNVKSQLYCTELQLEKRLLLLERMMR